MVHYLQADGSTEVLQQDSSLSVTHSFHGHIIDAEDPVSCLTDTCTHAHTHTHTSVSVWIFLIDLQ